MAVLKFIEIRNNGMFYVVKSFVVNSVWNFLGARQLNDQSIVEI